MRVDVYSRDQVKGLKPTPNTVVISITCPADPCPLKEGWEDILRLEFHDVALPPQELPPDLADRVILFDEEMAAQIRHFVRQHQDRDFVIHCAAGVSRSVAVGTYLRDAHGADLRLHAAHSDGLANGWVRAVLMREPWRKRLR